jgi:hypothetical protein
MSDDFGKREFMVSREGGGSRFRAWPATTPYPPFGENTRKVWAYSEEEAIAIVARGYSQTDDPPAVLVDAIEDAISKAQAGILDHGVQARAVLEAIDRIGR